MKRFSFAAAALVGLLVALVPASASAKVVELGATKTPLVAPTCPPGVTAANCFIVLTEVTAFETIGDGIAHPTTVTVPGEIVAFTLGLSQLDSNRSNARKDIHNLDSTYGGVAEASIAVIKQVGRKRLRRWKLMAESPPVHLIPFLGQVAQFPLQTPLPVKPGEVIALTVPTWAPVLSYPLPAKKFAYRQGRTGNCKNASNTQQAQTSVGQKTNYQCNYTGTRVEYSATEVTNPTPTKNHFAADGGG